MAVSQVVLYFDKQEDAVLFTLAASSVMSEGSSRTHDALAKVATEISKATRITTAGAIESGSADQVREQCA